MHGRLIVGQSKADARLLSGRKAGEDKPPQGVSSAVRNRPECFENSGLPPSRRTAKVYGRVPRENACTLKRFSCGGILVKDCSSASRKENATEFRPSYIETVFAWQTGRGHSTAT